MFHFFFTRNATAHLLQMHPPQRLLFPGVSMGFRPHSTYFFGPVLTIHTRWGSLDCFRSRWALPPSTPPPRSAQIRNIDGVADHVRWLIRRGETEGDALSGLVDPHRPQGGGWHCVAARPVWGMRSGGAQ